MIILSIETSCDETAVSLIEATGTKTAPSFRILGNALYSQIATHAPFGGVTPSLAKREHTKNLVPLFASVMKQAIDGLTNENINEGSVKKGVVVQGPLPITDKDKVRVLTILEREHSLGDALLDALSSLSYIPFDCIAVTEGPGLEPALWVGISFAKALSILFKKPLVPVNHMEGHIASVLMSDPQVEFPALALLISGGHTELVEALDWHVYKVMGQTVDDAIGEAFDKVARLLGLPYPGGPQISAYARESREQGLTKKYVDKTTHQKSDGGSGEKKARMWILPRPMIKSPDFNFSFSGIKTAVLYAVREKTTPKEGEGADGLTHKLTLEEKKMLAEEFENAVTEVLVSKTRRALRETKARTLIIGGGVTANIYIRAEFEKMVAGYNVGAQHDAIPEPRRTRLFVPPFDLSTDNSVMIAIAGYLRYITSPEAYTEASGLAIQARGNLSL